MSGSTSCSPFRSVRQRLIIIETHPLVSFLSMSFNYSVYGRAERGKLNFQKSTTCIFWPQKFSFKLPIVLKTDFERRDNAL